MTQARVAAIKNILVKTRLEKYFDLNATVKSIDDLYKKEKDKLFHLKNSVLLQKERMRSMISDPLLDRQRLSAALYELHEIIDPTPLTEKEKAMQAFTEAVEAWPEGTCGLSSSSKLRLLQLFESKLGA